MKTLLLRVFPDCTPKQAESMLAVTCMALALAFFLVSRGSLQPLGG
jgi:hypothetical protein